MRGTHARCYYLQSEVTTIDMVASACAATQFAKSTPVTKPPSARRGIRGTTRHVTRHVVPARCASKAGPIDARDDDGSSHQLPTTTRRAALSGASSYSFNNIVPQRQSVLSAMQGKELTSSWNLIYRKVGIV